MLRTDANAEFDFERLRQLVVTMVHGNSDVSPKELAGAIGKSYSTLCRETNPGDQGAKLGLEDFVRLTVLTRDFAPLRFIAMESGFFPRPEREEDRNTQTLSSDSLAMEMARLFFRLMHGWLIMRSSTDDKMLRKALLRDIDEYLQLVLHWKHSLEAGDARRE